ncbi:TonB-dependent siderophore receptor [Hydrogenophaga sp.]|uniref:TonB-dependent siderophore receptor n=1 Tax=Hydrogenophaga sp. TaxID=1904254 RepID=UPI003918A303
MAPIRPTTFAVATLLATLAHAQTAPTLPAVTITTSGAAPVADVTGFDAPLRDTPASVTVIDSARIAEAGARTLSDLYRFDSSVSDAYNAAGYYDYASVRGFVIDNTYNYRREGLPISGETSLPLDHLERVELLKGTSGIQAGTSAPGGLFNLVVKRPTATPQRVFRTEVNSNGNALAHVDISGRVAEGDMGWRLNVLGERLNGEAPGTEGKRGLLALAMDARLSRDSLLEGEFELSRRAQRSVPGLSLLGDQLPPADPKLNINHQPWSQPVDFRNFSGSLRFTQAINSQWNWQAQVGTQRLVTDDYLAYPYGCYDVGSGDYYPDRFCPNGDFDLYDYRSLDERRNTHSAHWRVNGQFATGEVRHKLSAGILASRFTQRGQTRSNYSGYILGGNLNTLPAVPANPQFVDTFTQRTERSTELFATDVIEWSPALQTWVGLRHTRLNRRSVETDGSEDTAYRDNVTTPWLAATYKLGAGRTVYGSWGQGIESEVVTQRPRYTNAGAVLPPLKSRQWELGLKSEDARQRWNVTLFSITRPTTGNLVLNTSSGCDDASPGSCTRVIDGEARHRGLELGGGRTSGAWTYDASLTWLDAERRHSRLTPELNGLRPTNVPRWILRANLSHRLASLPGVTLGAHLSHEGSRAVLPDQSLVLPSWTRVDASVRYDTRLGGQPATWTLAIDNLFNRRYFQEAPYQYEHIYLFPGAGRTLRVALDTRF